MSVRSWRSNTAMKTLKRYRRIYKTPNNRRLKKWRRRVERMVERAGTRGFKWFWAEMQRTRPLQNAADRLGVNLAAKFDDLVAMPIPREVLMEGLMNFILGVKDPFDRLGYQIRRLANASKALEEAAGGDKWKIEETE